MLGKNLPLREIVLQSLNSNIELIEIQFDLPWLSVIIYSFWIN